MMMMEQHLFCTANQSQLTFTHNRSLFCNSAYFNDKVNGPPHHLWWMLMLILFSIEWSEVNNVWLVHGVRLQTLQSNNNPSISVYWKILHSAMEVQCAKCEVTKVHTAIWWKLKVQHSKWREKKLRKMFRNKCLLGLCVERWKHMQINIVQK